MKLKHTHLAALTCASFLGSAALSQAAVIVSEDFSYGDGGLNGQNGGTGFSNAWSSSIGVTSGVATGTDPSTRSLATAFASSGTLWVSFDWGYYADPTESASYGGLTFYIGGSEKFLIGNTWPGTGHDLWQMNGSAQTSETNYGGMKTGVAKITLGADATSTVELWVGTTGSPVDVSGAAIATSINRELAGVDGIRIGGGDFGFSNPQSFDNLLIGNALLDVDATRSTAHWTNTGGGLWGTAGNWLDKVVGGGSGKTANFNTLDMTADTTLNLDSALTIGNLVFGDTDTSSAAGWTLANNGNGANILTLAGTTPTLTVNALGGTKTVTISAEVAGSDGLTKAGAGTLTLSGTNTYSGMTTISAGTLQIGDGSTTGSLSTSGAITNNGNLTINRSNAVTQGTDFSGSAITGSGSFTQAGAGTTTLTAMNSYSGGTTINGGILVASRDTLGTGAVMINDGGTLYVSDQWVLCGVNDHNVALQNIGTLTINAGGKLQLDATNGFANGATNLYLNGGLVTGGPNNHRGDLFLYNGNEQITADGATTSTIESVIGLTGNNNTITVVDGSTLNITGAMKNSDWANNGGGNGGFIKAGTGTLTLNAANTYTGLTTVSNGTLKLQGAAFSTTARDYTIATGGVLNLDGNTGFASGTTTIAGTGTLRITGGTFANESPNDAIKGPGRNLTMAMDGGAVIDVQSGAAMINGGWQAITWTNNKASLNMDGSFDMWDGQNVYVDALTGAGTVGGGGTQPLTVGVNNGSGTFSGVISGNIGLTKNGTGTQTLAGANSYAGATTVNNGTLVVSGQSYFNVGRTTTVASGAVLELNNSNNSFTSLMPVSTATGAGTFRLSGNSTISQDTNGESGNRLTFAMDAGGLIDLQDTSRLTNGGWQELNWTNNKASMNIASGATFDVWDGQDVILDALTGSGTVDKVHGGNSPRLLKVGIADGSGIFSGTMMNTGGQLAFTKVGTGTQTLSGTNTYTGATEVNGGKLVINGNNSAATGTITVAAGTVTGTPVATLAGSGTGSNGTIGGNVVLTAESSSGFNNGGVLAPTAAASGTKLSVAGTTSFGTGSIFEWDLNALTSDTGTTNQGDYGQLAGTGAISGSNAVFKVVLGSNAFTDAFWDTDKTWNNVFSGAGATHTLASMFSSIVGTGITYDNSTFRGNAGTEGYFTLSGTSSLSWTAVPEPTSALAGLLITAGLLRRRRA